MTHDEPAQPAGKVMVLGERITADGWCQNMEMYAC